MAIPNDQYWQQRFDRMKEDALVYTNTVVARIVKDYGKALAQVRKELAAWFQRFMDNNTITEINKALELLNGDELKELKWTLEEYIAKGKANAHDPRWIKELENASAKVHITRLQALELLIRQQSEDLHAKLQDHTQESMQWLYQDTYSHTAFEIQKGIGIGLEMGRGIDAQELDKIIHRPWASDGLDFSKRIWNDRDKLNQRLHRELTNMALTGDGPDKAINRIAKEFETDKRNAARLVQTEHAAMESAAHKDCFKDLGVDQYKFVATLDLKTSEICRAMDSKIFPMSKYKVGETAPPMHPRCRSTTAPYFEDVADLGKRWARGADGQTYSVPGDMTYDEWYKRYVEGEKVKANDRTPENKQHEGTKAVPTKFIDQAKDIIADAKVRYGNNGLIMKIGDKLNSKEIYALNKYFSSLSYVINEKLRLGKGLEVLSAEERSLVDEIDSAILKLPVYEGTVYRSLSLQTIRDDEEFNRLHQPGNFVRYQSYTSASTDVYDEDMEIQLIIESKHGRDLRNYNGRENEVLFKRSTEFMITKREGRTIWLKEM